MTLTQLLSALPNYTITGESGIEISSIETDSRRVTSGSLFAAIKGVNIDGHQFIESAIHQGATAIVCEETPPSTNNGVAYILVADCNEALGLLASQWYDNPSQKLTLVGVTGTNGKTTIATVLYNMFTHLGYTAGLLSTVCYMVNGKEYESTHTTPDALVLNRLLALMVEEGCGYCFMEVSSHALDQKRVAGLLFAGGIFTNLTRDHLDYHKTVDAYIAAKKSFFDNLPKEAFAISNADDKTGSVMLQNCKARKRMYALRTLADYHAKVVEDRIDGMTLEVNNREVSLFFTGRFNAYNLLAVYAAAVELTIPHEEALVALSTLKPVAGRFEPLYSPNGYTVIVDYAHTPDALSNVLSTINEVINGRGNVITVVGAGGNRDKGKRPIMAQEAANASQKVIITSDNPRFEEPNEIIDDMLKGLNPSQLKYTLAIADREQAIKTACMMAQSGDVILIAGKGHENYQEVKGVKHHFDDKEVVLRLFQTLS